MIFQMNIQILARSAIYIRHRQSLFFFSIFLYKLISYKKQISILFFKGSFVFLSCAFRR